MNFYCTFLLIFSFFMGSLFPVKIRKEKSVSMNAKRRNRMKKHIQCKRNHWNTSNTKDTKAIWYTFWKKTFTQTLCSSYYHYYANNKHQGTQEKNNLLSTWSIRMTGKNLQKNVFIWKEWHIKKMNRTFKRKLLTYDCMSTKWHCCCYCHYHHQRHH